MLFGENSQFVDVEILVNGVLQETLRFNAPPLNIEESASGQKVWHYIRGSDGTIVFDWFGSLDDNWYAEGTDSDGDKFLSYNFYLKKWNELSYSMAVKLPVTKYFDTDADGPFTAAFDFDYDKNYEIINDQITFADNTLTYTYSLENLTYNVKPDGLSSNGGSGGILYQTSNKSIVEFSINGFIRLILYPPIKVNQAANLFNVEDATVKYSFQSESTVGFQVFADSCEQPGQCSLIQAKYPGYSCVSC